MCVCVCECVLTGGISGKVEKAISSALIHLCQQRSPGFASLSSPPFSMWLSTCCTLFHLVFLLLGVLGHFPLPFYIFLSFFFFLFLFFVCVHIALWSRGEMPSTINVNWISSTITDGGKVSPSMDKNNLNNNFSLLEWHKGRRICRVTCSMTHLCGPVIYRTYCGKTLW